MRRFLNHIILKFDESERYQLEPYFKKAKAISTSIEEEVYFLGIILKYAVKNQELNDSIERKVHEFIKHSHFTPFYEQKKKPELDSFPIILSLVMTMMGLFLIVAGLDMLSSNSYIAGSSRTFGSFTSGGGMLLFGLLFLIGGGVKTIQQYRRNQFLSQISK